MSKKSACNGLVMAAVVLAGAASGTARAEGCLKGAVAGVIAARVLHTGHSLTAAALGCVAGHEVAAMSAGGAGVQRQAYSSYGGAPGYGAPAYGASGYVPNSYQRPYAGASAMVTQTPNELR